MTEQPDPGPTSEQVRKVVETFRGFLDKHGPDIEVRMSSCKTDPMDHPCRTPACHAGYYLLARCPDEKAKEIVDFFRISTSDGNDSDFEWAVGAQMMARDLGFTFPGDFQLWAAFNPELWGNLHGHGMFRSNAAFGMPATCENITLKDIIRHWEGFLARIEAREEAERPVELPPAEIEINIGEEVGEEPAKIQWRA